MISIEMGIEEPGIRTKVSYMYLYNIYLEQIVQHSLIPRTYLEVFSSIKRVLDEYLLSKKFKAQKVEASMKILLCKYPKCPSNRS